MREREKEGGRERDWEIDRRREGKSEWAYVCLCVSVCVWKREIVCVREIERVSVCVCEREIKREREMDIEE